MKVLVAEYYSVSSLKGESNRVWVYEADQNAIKEAEDALNEFNREDEIDDLEKEKEDALAALDEQIQGWEDYKQSWKDVVSDYEKEQERLILAQQLGAETENEILQQRIEAIERYRQKYLDTMKELQQWEEDPVGAMAEEIPISTGDTGSTLPSGGTSGGATAAPSLTKGSYVSVKEGTKWYSNSYGGGKSGTAHAGTIKYINTKGSHPYNIDGKGWVKKTDIVGYKDGGIVDYTGLAMLHGTKSKPEFVLNTDQMQNMLARITRPQVVENTIGGSSKTVNYNFGNIELPNVNNAKQFITELKSLINISRHQ